MRNFSYFTILLLMAIGCGSDNYPEPTLSSRVKTIGETVNEEEPPCEYPSYNCDGLKIRWTHIYVKYPTTEPCCPIESPSSVRWNNIYKRFDGSSCTTGNSAGGLSKANGSPSGGWINMACQAKYSDCGTYYTIKFDVLYQTTKTFGYVLEFQIMDAGGTQTFAVCSDNGPSTCSVVSQGNSAATFTYYLDDNCEVQPHNNQNCAIPDNIECPPES